jgi:glycosyltransferase involved in cell wall biosynthesis
MSDRDPITPDCRLMFLYLGRRGAMPRFMLDVMRAADARPDCEICALVSRQAENFEAYAAFGERVIGVDTFSRNAGALLSTWRIPLLRRRIAAEIRRRGIMAVVELMPHIWSPLLASAIQGAGARYLTVVHDAVAHPGDATSRVKGFTDRVLTSADTVITLSTSVAEQLRAGNRVSHDRLQTLFLPDLTYRASSDRMPRSPDLPLRLLFLGRIMPYKGLGLFVDAVEVLHKAGILIEIGVFGEGHLGDTGKQLARLGAEVVNRWLSEDEIAAILERFDVMVVSHIEASQSGVIATAFGAGLPVVVTPVGALPEQVDDGVTGLVAEVASVEALAKALMQLTGDRSRYARLCEGVMASRASRSMARFVTECVRLGNVRIRSGKT